MNRGRKPSRSQLSGGTSAPQPANLPRRRWIGYTAIAGGALLLGYALLTDSDDEADIRALLHDLAQTVSSSEPIANVAFRASFLRERFEEALAPDVRVDVPEVGRLPSDHQGLALAAARFHVAFGTFLVDLDDLSVTLADGPSSTSPPSARAQGRATLTRTGDGSRETRKVHFMLVKQSGARRFGKWAVSAIRVEDAQ